MYGFGWCLNRKRPRSQEIDCDQVIYRVMEGERKRYGEEGKVCNEGLQGFKWDLATSPEVLRYTKTMVGEGLIGP